MPFNIALSGLHAASTDLEVTGNNIANAGTNGFKESRAEFGDVYASAYNDVNDARVGSGVQVKAVTQQFNPGTIEYTGNSLDLGISGDGFFVVSSPDSDENLYTRAGAFQVDRDGYIVDSSGLRLQVFPPLEEGVTDPGYNTGVVDDLQVNFGDNPPRATTEVNVTMNLNSEEEQLLDAAGDEVDFDAADPDTYNYATSTTIYDSLGSSHTATFYYVKEEDPLEWTMYIGVEGSEDDPLEQSLVFDVNGELIEPTEPIEGEITLTGGTGGVLGEEEDPDEDDPETRLPITFDFSSLTQYGNTFSVTDLTQDGYTTGRLTGFEVDTDGVIFGRYTNGQSIGLGKVAMASFDNPQGLEQVGENNWFGAYAAGDVVITEANTGNLGSIESGGLEASNVDLAEQLVHLIITQRNYQANAQTVSTANQISQTIINLR